ncbi:MAG: CDP-alcohol phosphatidyltransferase family protein, partial [Pseudomonadota bacterium]
MTAQLRALSVHFLTASGAVFAMLAMLAAVDGKWDVMFLWLVVAFAVDGIDGPLARKYDVKLRRIG